VDDSGGRTSIQYGVNDTDHDDDDDDGSIASSDDDGGFEVARALAGLRARSDGWQGE